jgi:hypothetical protein
MTSPIGTALGVSCSRTLRWLRSPREVYTLKLAGEPRLLGLWRSQPCAFVSVWRCERLPGLLEPYGAYLSAYPPLPHFDRLPWTAIPERHDDPKPRRHAPIPSPCTAADAT